MAKKNILFTVLIITLFTLSNCSEKEATVTGYEKHDRDVVLFTEQCQARFASDIGSVTAPDPATLGCISSPKGERLTPGWDEAEFFINGKTSLLKVPLSNNSRELGLVLQSWDYDLNRSVMDFILCTLHSSLIFRKDEQNNSLSWEVESHLHPVNSERVNANRLRAATIISDQFGNCVSVLLNGEEQVPYDIKTLAMMKTIEYMSLVTEDETFSFTSAEFSEYVPTRSGVVCWEHDWRHSIIPCPHCPEGGSYKNCPEHGLYNAAVGCPFCPPRPIVTYCPKHGYPASTCYICETEKYLNQCDHGRQKDNCTYCGTDKCNHNGIRNDCSVCSSKPRCIHNNLQHMCSTCKKTSDPNYGRCSCNLGPLWEHPRNEGELILLPCATNCNYYHAWDQQGIIPRTCPPGLHFNPDKRICEFPGSARCEEQLPYR